MMAFRNCFLNFVIVGVVRHSSLLFYCFATLIFIDWLFYNVLCARFYDKRYQHSTPLPQRRDSKAFRRFSSK